MYVKHEWHIVQIKCAGLILVSKFTDYNMNIFLSPPKSNTVLEHAFILATM